MRKVAGEVNPADLFTKQLPSKDKIHQLTALFGCEYRDGRSAEAPLLRKNVEGQQGGHLSDDIEGEDPLPNFVMQDAIAHDPNILPHRYGKGEMDRMFPKIHAPKSIDNDDDWSPGENDQSWNHRSVEEKMNEEDTPSAAATAGRRSLSRAATRRRGSESDREVATW